MKHIRIATRGSRLALAQTRQVAEALTARYPGVSVGLVEISTRGDRDRSDFLRGRSEVGFFTSEVERALVDGRADVAVHSLKDLPTGLTEGLVIAAIPARECVYDTIVTAKPLGAVDDLPAGATIGTSSLRRLTQLRLLRSDLQCGPLRGNVETRIRKVRDGELDAIVVAQAGLNRLALTDINGLTLPPEQFIPAPGQGALAVQCRREDNELRKMLGSLNDEATQLAVETERQILAGLHGGCSIPLGVYARIEKQTLHIHAILSNPAATRHLKKTITCPIENAGPIADRLTQELLQEGADILEDIPTNKNRQTE